MHLNGFGRHGSWKATVLPGAILTTRHPRTGTTFHGYYMQTLLQKYLFPIVHVISEKTESANERGTSGGDLFTTFWPSNTDQEGRFYVTSVTLELCVCV